MKLSVLDMPPKTIDDKFNLYKEAIEGGTRFGIGSQHERPQSHPVMDEDWSVSRVTREKKDRAWKQLGTSGSGNHFVEFGVLTLDEDESDLGLDAGRFVALLPKIVKMCDDGSKAEDWAGATGRAMRASRPIGPAASRVYNVV